MFLKQQSSGHLVEVLKLDSCFVWDNGCKYLADTLLQFNQSQVSLRHLRLFSNRFIGSAGYESLGHLIRHLDSRAFDVERNQPVKRSLFLGGRADIPNDMIKELQEISPYWIVERNVDVDGSVHIVRSIIGSSRKRKRRYSLCIGRRRSPARRGSGPESV